MTTHSSPFLTAQWRNIVMLNFEIDPALIAPHVPTGTEIDFWNGKTFVSLVGFQFLQTRLKGWSVPFHRSFEEVNLRFYVRHKRGNEWRRGVVFLREIAPRLAVVLVARWIYNENYIALPMRSAVERPTVANGHRGSVDYGWNWSGQWCEIAAQISGTPKMPQTGSEAEFIAEHYWGYSRQRDGSTLEYRVDHPSWSIWPADSCRFHGDVSTLYGPDFATVLGQRPSFGFVADGSEIAVHAGQPVKDSVTELRNGLSVHDRDATPHIPLHSAGAGVLNRDPRQT
jgi:uncharacterized protein YqjF (DUF2071 family)